MKRLLLVTALTLGGTAHAVTWEYAFLDDSMGQFIWTTPAKSVVAKTGLFKDLLPQLKCKGTSWLDFFNCVGQQGWEYVGPQAFSTSRPDEPTYIFKRQKK